jgi:hypothetical protein
MVSTRRNTKTNRQANKQTQTNKKKKTHTCGNAPTNIYTGKLVLRMELPIQYRVYARQCADAWHGKTGSGSTAKKRTNSNNSSINVNNTTNIYADQDCGLANNLDGFVQLVKTKANMANVEHCKGPSWSVDAMLLIAIRICHVN